MTLTSNNPDVRYEPVPDPRILHAGDVILRVTATSICGSDLHIYNGYRPQRRPAILGHEFMGVVEEAGPRVLNFRKGDRLIVPFPIACGRCWFCEHEQPVHCMNTNRTDYGPDGISDHGGGQAEHVRVPYADFNCRKAPPGVPDERLLLLSDVIPAGWCAAEWCAIKPGDCVAVFGCGPAGLMAMKSAWLQGAGRVIGVDVLA